MVSMFHHQECIFEKKVGCLTKKVPNSFIGTFKSDKWHQSIAFFRFRIFSGVCWVTANFSMPDLSSQIACSGN